MKRIRFSEKSRSGDGRTYKQSGWKALGTLTSAGVGAALCISGALAQDIHVRLNGQPVAFQDVGPQQVQGRVLVPVRGVLEKLGAEIAWVPKTRSVVASTANLDIELKIGQKTAMVNGNPVTLDVPAQMIRNHTMVPLRFLSEALGAEVRWNGPERTVLIRTKDGGGQAQNPLPPQPERTPPPANGPAPTINSFMQSAKGWLHPGQAINVEMSGTPGGQAAFRIPGLTEALPMREASPGRYVGVWTVPGAKPVQLSNAAIIGSLSANGKAAPLIQAADMVSVDAIPPRIRDRAPDPDSRVSSARPNIYAIFDEQGSGVNPDAVRLLLNGRDVTRDATVNRDFISYTPPANLPPGPQTVQIVCADRAGNRVQSNWNFISVQPTARGIQSVTHNANRALEPGDSLHVEMAGVPGGRAAFSLGKIQNIAMREVSPGRYAGDYTIKKGDDTTDKRLTVGVTTPDGQKFVQQSDRAIKVVTGKPMTPVITYPTASDTPSDPLVIKGKGTPNTKVRVHVDYTNKVLGALTLKGTAADAVVDVDKAGNWQTEPIQMRNLFSGRNVQYNITASSISAAQQTSDNATMAFRLR